LGNLFFSLETEKTTFFAEIKKNIGGPKPLFWPPWP